MTRPLMMLTVQQPWASLLLPTDEVRHMVLTGVMPEWAAALPKNVENRVWGTAYRGDIVIHAGLQVDAAAMMRFGLDPDRFVRGYALGVVRLVDVVAGADSVWAERSPHPGKWMRHWLVDRPRLLPEPVKCRGVQGFKPAPDNVIDAVHKHLSRI